MLKKTKSFYNDIFIICIAFVFCLFITGFINKKEKEGFYSRYNSDQKIRPRSLKISKNWASMTPDSLTREKPDKHNDKPYLYQDYIGEIKEIYKVYDGKEERNIMNESHDLYKYMLDEMRNINGTRKILDIRSFQEYL